VLTVLLRLNGHRGLGLRS